MFKDIFRAFGQQFPHWRNRWLLIGLMLLMAAVPVGELLVFQIFSTLLVESSDGALEGQVTKVLGLLALFFVGFAIARGLHHLTKFWRVKLFRSAFADLQETSGLGAAQWTWAQAFGVSTIIADLVQVVALVGLLFYFDLVVGGASAVLTALLLLQLSLLYHRQLRVQHELMVSPVRNVEAPIRERIFSGEFSALAASAATGLALALVAWRTFTGGLDIATAIVLAMAMRMYFGRLAGIAPVLMRFARDTLRLERDRERFAASAQGMAASAPLGDEEDDLEGDVARPPQDAAAARRRAGLVGRLLIEAQRGEGADFHQAAHQLWSAGELTEKERDAMRGAEAFLAYSGPLTDAGRDAGPVRLFWWPKPLPGSFDEWLNPYLIHSGTKRAVQFVPLASARDAPSSAHLVLGGSLAAYAQQTSIAVGTGVSKLEARVNPDAQFLSLRGPLTSRVVRRNGGPQIDTFGDPRLLVSRVHRVGLGETNGRLAFVRNHSEAEVPYGLPRGMDELPLAGSKPEQIAASLTALAGYDGVVTSSLGVVMICQSYGIPCALMVLDGTPRAKRVDMEFRDHLLGAGLEGDWQLHRVPAELDTIDWRARLTTEQVSSEKLDEIGSALEEALRRYTDLLEDEVDRAIREDQDDDE